MGLFTNFTLQRGDQIRHVLVANEIASVAADLTVVLYDSFWQQKYGKLTPSQMAAELKRFAGHSAQQIQKEQVEKEVEGTC